MHTPKTLLENNKKWAAKVTQENPDFFHNLAKQQHPKYLWIGCADSRVPANQIIGLRPGEVFVHRNIANVVSNSDLNCLSVIQYAVEVLKVTDIIVCGHYGCGGVRAALSDKPLGLIDNWLRHIKDVYERSDLPCNEDVHSEACSDKLCELNVGAQVRNVCHTTIVQQAWSRGQKLSVHGWVYSLEDGLINDLGFGISSSEQLERIYRMA